MPSSAPPSRAGPILLRAATTGALALALVSIAAFTTGGVRGYLGDVLVVTFIAAVAATGDLGTPRQRLSATAAIAVGTELFQALELVGPDAPLLLHLTLGSTFDPLDLVAYGIGLGLAALLEGTLWAAPPPAT